MSYTNFLNASVFQIGIFRSSSDLIFNITTDVRSVKIWSVEAPSVTKIPSVSWPESVCPMYIVPKIYLLITHKYLLFYYISDIFY